MKIGLCYDLRDEYLAVGYTEDETAEFDRLSTIEAVEQTLEHLGHKTERIGNARRLMARLVTGDRWDLVFNIAEGLRGIGREAQVPCILDVYGIPYTFSDALVMTLSLHKGFTKRVLRDGGLRTPDFAVIESLDDIAACDLTYPLFAKPVAEGTGKGIDGRSVIATPDELRQCCISLLARYHQPVLVERYLSGREFTVGIAGTGSRAEVLGTLEIVLLDGAESGAYGYENKERCEELVTYRCVSADDPLVRATESLALDAWRLMGCRDAGRIDLRTNSDGLPELIELNPLAGLNPEHSDLPMICSAVGITYEDLLARVIASASERVEEVTGHEDLRVAQPRLVASWA